MNILAKGATPEDMPLLNTNTHMAMLLRDYHLCAAARLITRFKIAICRRLSPLLLVYLFL